jgi:7-carboxy-7-deazaguanine synthase
MRVRYSEIFYSFQGEAELAGVPSVWLRFFGCNLNCHGFGQADPTNPSTYVLPYENFNLDGVKSVDELPVWKYGCDSSYSWSTRYKHLANDVDIPELVNRLTDANRSEHNPDGLFIHPKTSQRIMMCFTGGEPMLQQTAIMETLREFHRRGNMPKIVTIETNATRGLTKELSKFISLEFRGMGGERWHWAMSPKLFTVSGEADMVKANIILDYAHGTTSTSVLKFVCNGTDENWNELDKHLKTIRLHAGMKTVPSVWIMPVGATKDAQEHPDIADLCIEAMQRGFNVATRNQCYVFGNIIGR